MKANVDLERHLINSAFMLGKPLYREHLLFRSLEDILFFKAVFCLQQINKMTTRDMKLISALSNLPVYDSIIFWSCPSWYQPMNVTL